MVTAVAIFSRVEDRQVQQRRVGVFQLVCANLLRSFRLRVEVLIPQVVAKRRPTAHVVVNCQEGISK